MSLITNLVSYWKLDGDVLDVHGANNGTPTAVTYGSGKISQAAQGNGSTSVVDVGTANLNLTGAFSFACWVRPVNSAVQFLFTRCVANGITSSTYEVRISSNSLELCGAGGAYLSGGSVPAGTWSHVCATRAAAGGASRLYVNGVQVATSPTSTVPTSLPAQTTLIGSRDDANTFFNCLIDEIGVWDRVLTPTEAAYLANSGIGIAYPLVEVLGNFDYFVSEQYETTIGAPTVAPFYIDSEQYSLPVSEISRNLANIAYVGGCPDPEPEPEPEPVVDAAPTVYSVRSLSANLLEVLFSEDVVLAEALNPASYSLTGGITIRSVINVGGTLNKYRVTTSNMEPSTSYTLTVTGIHDLAGTSI